MSCSDFSLHLVLYQTQNNQQLNFFLLHTIIFCQQVFTVTMRKREKGEKKKHFGS